MNTQPLITLIKNRVDDINALPSYAAAIEGVQAANLGMTVLTNLDVIVAALESYGTDCEARIVALREQVEAQRLELCRYDDAWCETDEERQLRPRA